MSDERKLVKVAYAQQQAEGEMIQGLIVSLAAPDAPDLKGFWIRDGKIAEAELVVE